MRRRRFIQVGEMKNLAHTLPLMELPLSCPFCTCGFNHTCLTHTAAVLQYHLLCAQYRFPLTPNNPSSNHRVIPLERLRPQSDFCSTPPMLWMIYPVTWQERAAKVPCCIIYFVCFWYYLIWLVPPVLQEPLDSYSIISLTTTTVLPTNPVSTLNTSSAIQLLVSCLSLAGG